MAYANRAKSSKSVGFLDIPRELRDKIYRNFLLQPMEYNAVRQQHNLQTDILRVNKQIHQEASKVLYEENAWVLFEMHSQGVSWNFATEDDILTIPRDSVRYGELPFGGTPSLRVHVQDDDPRDPGCRNYAIVPLEWVGDFARAFLLDDMPPRIELAVHFHGNQKHESRQGMAMEFLKLIRGVKKANVTGLTPPSLGGQLAELMMTPISSMDELIDRTSEYIRRADLMLAQGRVYRAEVLYDQGYKHSSWAVGTTFMEGLPDYTRAKFEMLGSKFHECFAGSAFCCIRHGDHRTACTILKMHILDDDTLPNSHHATAFYYYGLALVAEGVENEALFALMQALLLQPGYAAVDREVDTLEERVTKGIVMTVNEAIHLESSKVMSLEEFRMRWNLDLINACRHNNAGGQGLSRQRKDTILADFKRDDGDTLTGLAL